MKHTIILFPFLLFLLLSLCHPTFASGNYFPQGMKWKIEVSDYCEGEQTYTKKTIIVKNDTIINDILYTMIDNIPVRENAGRIYCYVKDWNDNYVEHLLYDYNLKKGDSIVNALSQYVWISKVTNVDTLVLLDGRQARRIQYNNRDTDIEYIGNIVHGFFSPLYPIVVPCMSEKFLCCSVDNKLLFEAYQGACECKKEPHTFPDTWYCINEQRSWGANPNGPDDVSLNMAKYYLDGDTVINDTIYNKLYYNSYYIDSDNKNLHLIGGIRYNSDTSKIFIRPIIEGKSVEYLLYDYNLQIGDTCYAFCRGVDDWFISGNERIGAFAHMMICKDITIVGNQRRFTMQNKSLENEPLLVWIENIGTLYGLFGRAHTFNPLDEQYSDHPLLCALRGDEVLYSRPDNELTHIGHHGVINHCSSFEEIKAAVDNITIDLDPDAPMFNVLGLPVGKDYRGIVIQNGRKYVVL